MNATAIRAKAAETLREALRFPSGQPRISIAKAREVIDQIAFPWAGETPQRATVKCEKADLIAAYAQVQRRFEVRMAEFRRAEMEEA